jgi:DNA polymerase elongation subunit (family B)
MRQHSTPPWVASLQQRALELLASGTGHNDLPGSDVQRRVWRLYKAELQRLEQRTVPLEELVVTRRVTSTLRDYRVKNLTYAALMRAHEQGHHVPPGGKIRYVVVNSTAVEPLNRVLLSEELASSNPSIGGCASHYAALAERAVWAILAPFGWTNEQIRMGGRQPTLEEFTSPHDEAVTNQPTERSSGC